MVNRILIEQVPRAPKKTRAAFGKSLHEHYRPLQKLLSNTGRDGMGEYLAEPSVDQENTIAWYTSGVSRAQPFSSLDEQEQRDLLLKVKANHDAMIELAGRYEGGSEEAQKAATLINEVIPFPEEKHIYSVGGEPRIVFWSHEPETTFNVEDKIDHLEDQLGIPRTRPQPVAEPDAGTSGNTNDVWASHGRGAAQSSGTRETLVYRDVAHLFYGSYVHFVGAISFFGIALASLLTAITLLVFALSW